MKAVLPALARPLLAARLPDAIHVTWVTTPDEACAAIVDADIAWVDLPPHGLTGRAVPAATRLRWLFTAIAGVESLDLTALRERGTTLTNGAGINAIAVAEYAVLGVLAAAKRFDTVVRLADGRTWPTEAPGRIELSGTTALVVGYGAIGRLIGERLAAFDVAVTGVTRSGRDGTLPADGWKARLGEFDWVILAAPSTTETRALIGADEIAAMKTGAWLVNVARGDMIDDDALIAALRSGKLAGAFLDPTEPEPLPADHPYWDEPNVILSMHLSGRSQSGMFRRAAALFLDNLDAFLGGRAMRNVVDLDAGY